MVFPIATSHKSLLLHISSNAVGTTHPNSSTVADYSVHFANRAHLNNVKKILPYKILIPNVFPNLPTGTLTVNQNSTSTNLIIPEGQYTFTAFQSLWNTQFPNVQMTLNAAQQIILTSTTHEFTVTIPDNYQPILGVTTSTLQSFNNVVTGVNPVNMGGKKLIHVAADFAGANLVHSNDQFGTLPVICSVSLHNVQYGQYAELTTQDFFADDYDWGGREHSLQTCRIRLLDDDFNLVNIPSNFPVTVMLQVYFKDGPMG